jgi:hypothetical protein
VSDGCDWCLARARHHFPAYGASTSRSVCDPPQIAAMAGIEASLSTSRNVRQFGRGIMTARGRYHRNRVSNSSAVAWSYESVECVERCVTAPDRNPRWNRGSPARVHSRGARTHGRKPLSLVRHKQAFDGSNLTAKIGGESGIRTLGTLLDSVTCRFQVAGNARNAGDAVTPCPLLPAATYLLSVA